MAKHSSHVLELAKRGAEAQLQDLVNEIKMLVQMFPHLRDFLDKDELPIGFIIAADSGALAARQRRRAGTAAAVNARRSAARTKRRAKTRGQK